MPLPPPSIPREGQQVTYDVEDPNLSMCVDTYNDEEEDQE
jgi:hypothetical protein